MHQKYNLEVLGDWGLTDKAGLTHKIGIFLIPKTTKTLMVLVNYITEIKSTCNYSQLQKYSTINPYPEKNANVKSKHMAAADI